MIDETHTLNRNPEVVRDFFNEAQALAGKGHPLLLVFASTPDISSRLNEIEATFLEPLGQNRHSAALQEMLRNPPEPDGLLYAGPSDQCGTVPSLSSQLVGRELHRPVKAEPDKLVHGNRIGGAILEQSMKALLIARNIYYADRCSELETIGILVLAEAMA